MILETPQGTGGYKLLDTGEDFRLEQWGPYILMRPDPQIIWPKSLGQENWEKANAKFISGRGEDRGQMGKIWRFTGKMAGTNWQYKILGTTVAF
jgi:23S rRNA (cytosine1962-C5)-methyltransferase